MKNHAQSDSDMNSAQKLDNFLMETDWGGLLKYEVANSQLLADKNRTIEIIFMGDSITESWSTYSPAFFSNNSYVNRGCSGQTTGQMLLRFRQDVIALKPKAVFILAGINDIAQNTKFYGLEVVASHLFSMIELAKANNIIPVICSVLPADKFKWRPAINPASTVVQLNVMLQDYAKKNNLIYLDYYNSMHNGNGGLKTELTVDGVHLTKKGYLQLEQLVQATTTKLFK